MQYQPCVCVCRQGSHHCGLNAKTGETLCVASWHWLQGGKEEIVPKEIVNTSHHNVNVATITSTWHPRSISFYVSRNRPFLFNIYRICRNISRSFSKQTTCVCLAASLHYHCNHTTSSSSSPFPSSSSTSSTFSSSSSTYCLSTPPPPPPPFHSSSPPSPPQALEFLCSTLQDRPLCSGNHRYTCMYSHKFTAKTKFYSNPSLYYFTNLLIYFNLLPVFCKRSGLTLSGHCVELEAQ